MQSGIEQYLPTGGAGRGVMYVAGCRAVPRCRGGWMAFRRGRLMGLFLLTQVRITFWENTIKLIQQQRQFDNRYCIYSLTADDDDHFSQGK